MNTTCAHDPVRASKKAKARLFLLVALPFFLNDFGNMAVTTFQQFIVFDYIAVKAVPLAILGWGLRRGIITLADLGLKRLPLKTFGAWLAVLLFFSLIQDEWIMAQMARVLPSLKLVTLPIDEKSSLFPMDCFLGLSLVAFCEEIIFRGLAFTVLRERFKTPLGFYLATSAIFGLIHWSVGLPAVLNAGIIGAMFMPAMVRTGSVWPQIVAHFVVDFVFFCDCLMFGTCKM